ncbi:MAG: hypothetical protein IBX50_18575 [Marinospirillum sp.]|uniref:hypothetical protein n=1 Tax=Marinospirillum sp. TaxID=2183934 RepID=UPI0019D9750A|nr:hypothetical protein [Marinospirillum sp.]MBE0508693.1 hypothetical protein [Marinospirillum sp.]
MARLSPKTETVRALFARSGNQCAFPGCTQPLINDRNQFIGQICHIEAALPGGERYNHTQSDEDRRAYENLLLLCYPHHVETNDTDEYSVDRLHQLKRDHEAVFEKSSFKIDETALYKIIYEMDQYWVEIERLNTIEHAMVELAFSIDAKSSYLRLVKACEENIAHLSSIHDTLRNSDDALQKDFERLLQRKGIDPQIFHDIPYYESPFQNRNWELHSLGIPNCMQQLRIHLMHMEIKYLEEYLKTNNKDATAQARLKVIKKQFAELAQHAIFVD